MSCLKECRNVLLPAFWSPSSRNVKTCVPAATTLENGLHRNNDSDDLILIGFCKNLADLEQAPRPS